MDKNGETLCTVKATDWPWRYTFILTPDAVIRQWSTPGDGSTGENRYPLDSLSCRLSYRSEFGSGGWAHFRKAALLIACGVCVYFSDINRSIPLLAPFLALPGLAFLVRGAARLRQFTWTVIERKDGERVVWIRHHRWNVADREIFEKAFKETMTKRSEEIRTANQALEATSGPAPGAAFSSPQG